MTNHAKLISVTLALVMACCGLVQGQNKSGNHPSGDVKGSFGLVSMLILVLFGMCGTFFCVYFTCCHEYMCEPAQNAGSGYRRPTGDELKP